MNALAPLSTSQTAITALETQVRGHCSPSVAARYVKQLLAMFPGQRNRDDEIEEIYAAGLTHVLADWPEWVVQAAVDPSRGLPSKHTFRPTPAEVAKFCNEAMRPVVAELREMRDRRDAAQRVLGPVVTPADRQAVADMVAGYHREVAERDTDRRSKAEDAYHKLLRRTQCAPGEAIREHELNQEVGDVRAA